MEAWILFKGLHTTLPWILIGYQTTFKLSNWWSNWSWWSYLLNKKSYRGSDTWHPDWNLVLIFAFFVQIWGFTIWHLNCNQEKMAQNLLNFQLLVDALLFFLLSNYLKVNLNFGWWNIFYWNISCQLWNRSVWVESGKWERGNSMKKTKSQSTFSIIDMM